MAMRNLATFDPADSPLFRTAQYERLIANIHPRSRMRAGSRSVVAPEKRSSPLLLGHPAFWRVRPQIAELASKLEL